MGCQHSTPVPTEADFLVEYPLPASPLCKSLKPTSVGSTFDFELAKKCWKTDVGRLQNNILFAPVRPSPDNNDRQVLVQEDELSKALAVLVMEDPKKPRIQICSFMPSKTNQKSCGEHHGRPIYLWALVEKIRNSNQFGMATTDDIYYRTDLYGPVSAHVPAKFVIKRRGVFCASVEEE